MTRRSDLTPRYRTYSAYEACEWRDAAKFFDTKTLHAAVSPADTTEGT